MPDPTARPVVVTDPAVNWGNPHIGGAPVDAVADAYLAGDDPADDYDLARHQLLTALWHAGMHGLRRHRRALGKWAETVAYPVLAGWDKQTPIDAVPLPEVPDA